MASKRVLKENCRNTFLFLFLCRAWDEAKQSPLCLGARVCSSSIKSLAVDEYSTLWVGSEKGHVRRVLLHTEVDNEGNMSAPSLIVSRRLLHTGAGASERSLDAEIGEIVLN